MGSMGSAKPMEFQRRVPKTTDFEHIIRQMPEDLNLKFPYKKCFELSFEKKVFWNTWIWNHNAET